MLERRFAGGSREHAGDLGDPVTSPSIAAADADVLPSATDLATEIWVDAAAATWARCVTTST